MKIKSILNGFFMGCMVGLLACGIAPAEEPLEYVGSNQCKLCHNKPDEGQQYMKWKSDPHARAYTVLLSDRAKEVAKESGVVGDPHEATSCLQCHVTGYDVESKAIAKGMKKEEGVQCEACHGPGSGHLVDGKELRMNKDAQISLLDKLVHPDEKTCAQCHNEQNPTWDNTKYTLEDGTTTGFSLLLPVARRRQIFPSIVC